MKAMVIPIVSRALETVPKSLEKRLMEMKTRDHPDQSIVKISKNTKKSPEDLRRLAVTKTPVKDLQLKLVWKTRKE